MQWQWDGVSRRPVWSRPRVERQSRKCGCASQRIRRRRTTIRNPYSGIRTIPPLSPQVYSSQLSIPKFHWICYFQRRSTPNQISRAPSPRQAIGGGAGRDDLVGVNHERKKSVTMTETPCSLSPSSDERPRSRTASHLSRPQSQHSRAGKERRAECDDDDVHFQILFVNPVLSNGN